MEYIVPLFSIIMINILLSGDNALVIALASRKLTAGQQKAVMIWGSAGAIGLRVGLTFIAVLILRIPYLQMVGGVLLLWIAIKLITDQKHHGKVEAENSLWVAVKTIIIADVVMSLDNVIAIIGIAKGNTMIVVIGLVISIPIIIFGSKIIGIFIAKWPFIITVGSIFLGWTAGEMVIADRQLLPIVDWHAWLKWVLPSIFAIIVVAASKLISNKRRQVKDKK